MFWLFTLTDVFYSDCKFFSLYTASEKLILEKGSHSYLTNEVLLVFVYLFLFPLILI